MTTFSAYLDALASNAASKQGARKHWLISGVAQHIFLIAVDVVVLTVAMLIAVQARGLVPFDGGDFSHQFVFLAPALGAVWLGLIHAFGGYQLRYQRAGATEYKRVVMASFAMAGAVGIGSYLAKAEFPRGVYVLLFTIGTAGLVTAL